MSEGYGPHTTPIEIVAGHLAQIKWMIAGILLLFTLASGAVTCMVIMGLRRGRDYSPDIRNRLSDLLDKGELDTLINEASERTSSHPNDGQAHWYLARAYHQKEDWFRALKAFQSVARISPDWRQEYIEPYVEEIQEKIRHGEADDAKD